MRGRRIFDHVDPYLAPAWHDEPQPRGLVCPNGHAMDEGYFECPCCGAYRPSRILKPGMTSGEQMAAIRRATSENQHGTED